MARKKLPLLHEAVKFAAKMHRGQDRDGGFPVPYITHPLDVTNHLRYRGDETDPEILAAAILHDVVEECDVKLADLEKRFGSRVGGLVKELTRREPSSAEIAGFDADQVWQLRSDWLLEDIQKMSVDAKRIKLADRLSNLTEAISTRPPDRLKRYVQQTYLILEAIPREVCPELWDEVRRLADEDVK